VSDGAVEPQLVFFFYDADFSLFGEANSCNSQYLNAENPRLIHELPRHDE
jgi:hypothetical protein